MGHLSSTSTHDTIMLTKTENRTPKQEGMIPYLPTSQQEDNNYEDPGDNKDNKNNRRRTPRPSAKLFCRFCKVIEEKNIPAYSKNMQFTQDQRDHLIIKNDPIIRFPDRCGKFFKLSIKDREQVLKDTEFCTTCMIHAKLHGQESCQTLWQRLRDTDHKAAKVKCSQHQCFKHWAMCPEHKTSNITRYE